MLAFYRQPAFNRHATVAQRVADLERHDPLSAYDVLRPLLGRGTRVLEVGCGTGWLSNSIARRHGAAVTGIDMNPDVVAFAREAAKAMRLPSQFECADLFRQRPPQPAQVVVSMGVLHHSHDCAAAVRRVCGEFLAPGGHALDRPLSSARTPAVPRALPTAAARGSRWKCSRNGRRPCR